MRYHRHLALCLACVTWIATSTARADIVIEVDHGKRPAQARPIVAGFHRTAVDQLGAKWTAARDALRYVPQPGVLDPKITASDLFDRIELGKRESVRVLPDGRVNFKGGEAALAAALEAAHANAAVIVVDPNARAALTRAAVGLAISRIRLGDQAGADEVLADLARTYSGAPLVDQGAEVEKQYNRVNTALARLPRGKLLILVNDPDAVIFVDEVGVGRGGTFSADMIPGLYRVVILSHGNALRYEVPVESGAQAKLDLDWEIETSIRVWDDSVGLELASKPSDKHLLEIARSLRARTSTSEDLVVLQVEPMCGYHLLSSFRYPDSPTHADRQSLSGQVLVGIPDGANAKRLLDLAKYVFQQTVTITMVGEKTVSGLAVGDAMPSCDGIAPPERAALRGARAPARDGDVSAGLAIAGIAFTGGGIAYYFLGNTNEQHPATLQDPKVQALAITGIGSYSLGAGIAGWLHETHGLRWAPTIALAFGIGSVVEGTLLVMTDQDPGPTQPMAIRDSALTGAILGGVGLASIATTYLLSRGEQTSGSPIVSISRDHAYLGWARAF